MRVPVRSSRRSDDQGAVAVLVALLVLVMVGFLAFVTDFGFAYANKRSLQNGVDAAALTYAQELHLATPEPANCDDLIDDPAVRAAAHGKAVQIFRDNASSDVSVTPVLTPRCDEPGLPNLLVVNARAGRSTPAFVGRALRPDDLHIQAGARAVVGPAKTLTGVRPFAVCDQLADFAAINPGVLLTIDFDNVNQGCGAAPGNFGTIDLRNPPPPGGVGSAVLEDWVEYGFDGTVPADVPATYNGDTGLPASNLRDEFREILGDNIIIPVYTARTGVGANSVYTVDRYIGVKVCGFRLVSNDSIESVACFVPDATTDNSLKRFVQLAFENFISTAEINAACRIGDPCDRAPLTLKLAD